MDTTNKTATDPLPLSGRNRVSLLLLLPIWGMFFDRRSVPKLTVSRYRPPPPQGYYNSPPPPQQYQPPVPHQGGYQQGGYQPHQQSQGSYRTNNGGYAPPTGAPVESNYHHTSAGYNPLNAAPHHNYAPYGTGAPSESSSTARWIIFVCILVVRQNTVADRNAAQPPSQAQHYGPQLQGQNGQSAQPYFQYSQCESAISLA